MPVCTHLHAPPQAHSSVFVAPDAQIIGAVSLAEHASVWYQCVLRADIERIVIGPSSNIQDGTIIHLSSDLGTTVGQFVTCGHKALLHACTVDDEVLIGMGAILMDGVEVGARSIIGAGSLVTQGTIIPPGSLVMGSPARVINSLDLEKQKSIRHWAEKYVQVAKEHSNFLANS